jgi:ribosomal protein S18 acetylase RimI-like enzyme
MVKLVRAALAEEHEVLALAQAFHREDGHPLKASSPGAIRALLAGSPLGEIYLLEREGQVVGYCALCFTMSLEFGGLVVILDDLYVKPAERGAGVGRAALALVEAIARGRQAVQLFLEVEHANARAFRLYERCGFRRRERHMMEKMLG